MAMMADLGAAYLYFAIQVLHNACPAKGYTAHVLGYTLHAILDTISKVTPPHGVTVESRYAQAHIVPSWD